MYVGNGHVSNNEPHMRDSPRQAFSNFGENPFYSGAFIYLGGIRMHIYYFPCQCIAHLKTATSWQARIAIWHDDDRWRKTQAFNKKARANSCYSDE